MKKVACITFLVFLTFEVVNAQVLRTIIFADTRDAKIGYACANDLSQFMQFKMALSTALGLENADVMIVRRGAECNKTELLKVLNNFTCSDKDVVIFAYFGHGTRAVMDPSPYPQMCLGSSEQSQFYPLKSVYDKLMEKKPRLCLALGDCCNKTSPYVLPKNNFYAEEAAPMSCSTIRTFAQRALKTLFLGNKGGIICAGCKPDQYSWCNERIGSFFSSGLLDELVIYSKENNDKYDWNTLMTRVTNKVEAYSRNASLMVDGKRYIQTPIWSLDLITAGVINGSGRVPDGIRTTLVSLSDERNNTPSARLSMISSVSSQFTKSAVIDIVSVDNKVVVETNDLNTFLLHVATTFRLRNFDIKEEKRDSNGKITYLRLHEIYVE